MTDGAAKGGYHHGDLAAALLRAAESELAENGAEGFSLRACARRAGVSHAAPKHHFGSAEGLLDALAAEGFRRLLAAMSERMAEEREPRARLRLCGEGYVRFAAGNPALFKLMFRRRTAGPPGPELAAAGGAAFAVLREAVAALSPEKSAGETGLDIAAAWAIVHGLAHLLIEGSPAIVGALGGAAEDGRIAAVLTRLGL